MGGAAVSPFAGLIGQKEILHDPYKNESIKRFKSHKELQELAREGDVIISTKPGRGIWKDLSAPFTGSPFYHAQPVVGKSKKTVDAGAYLQSTPRNVLSHSDTLKEFAAEYPDLVVLRPKQKLTPEQIKQITQENLKRTVHPYDKSTAIKLWLEDIFKPKSSKPVATQPLPSICEGNVCSTMPAMAYQRAGMKVDPTKLPTSIHPTDYLRSSEFTPVGAMLTGKNRSSRVMPYLSRAGLGAAMAGSIYGLSESPEAAAIPIGALAANAAVSGLSKPGTPNLHHWFLPEGQDFSKVHKAIMMRRLPAMLAGGGLAYAGAKKLKEKLSE
jgi:hypothetical protein